MGTYCLYEQTFLESTVLFYTKKKRNYKKTRESGHKIFTTRFQRFDDLLSAKHIHVLNDYFLYFQNRLSCSLHTYEPGKIVFQICSHTQWFVSYSFISKDMPSSFISCVSFSFTSKIRQTMPKVHLKQFQRKTR